MNLTERYIRLCRELADAGYQWLPRPGDWMLDIMDESVGMLTMPIERPELVRKLNVQIPYGEQIRTLLAARKCRRQDMNDAMVWSDRGGAELHRCASTAYAPHDDEEELAALVADFRRHGP